MNDYANKILDLCFRVIEISDGDEVDWTPVWLFDVVVEYDLEEAERMSKKIYEKQRWKNSDLILALAMAKIAVGFPLIKGEYDEYEENQKDEDSPKPVYELLREFRSYHHYEDKPDKTPYEQRFKIYLEVAKSPNYTEDERKEAFNLAYAVVEEIKGLKVDRFLSAQDWRGNTKRKLEYRELCKKYKKKPNLDLEEENNDSDREGHRMKIEEDFVKSLERKGLKTSFTKQLLSISKYESKLTITQKESWQRIHNKSVELGAGIKPFIELISNSYYWGLQNMDYNDDYLHYPIAIALSDPITQLEMFHYLSGKTGGIGSLWRMSTVFSEMNKKDECVDILNRYYKFCVFLLY